MAQSERRGFGFPSAVPEQQEEEEEEEEECKASAGHGTSGQPRSQLSLGLELLFQGDSINLLIGDWDFSPSPSWKREGRWVGEIKEPRGKVLVGSSL